jgi:hypothetical protein
MVRPQILVGGEIEGIVAKMLNKQFRIDQKGLFSSLGTGQGANKQKKTSVLRDVTQDHGTGLITYY